MDATSLRICLANRGQLDFGRESERGFIAISASAPPLRTPIRVNDDGNPEFIPTSFPIWLRVVPRANDTQWLREVDTELALPFELGDRPLLRVVLVQGEDVSELILAIHHSIGDGASAMYLVRDLLRFMEGYELEKLPLRSCTRKSSSRWSNRFHKSTTAPDEL